jgi:hypothetical protein
MSVIGIAGARALAFALVVMPVSATAAEPVRHVAIYVEPFYRSAIAPGQKSFNGLLASTRGEDIAAVRDLILVKPKTVTPMGMMAHAIRLCDVGLRDDAVIWFYTELQGHG